MHYSFIPAGYSYNGHLEIAGISSFSLIYMVIVSKTSISGAILRVINTGHLLYF